MSQEVSTTTERRPHRPLTLALKRALNAMLSLEIAEERLFDVDEAIALKNSAEAWQRIQELALRPGGQSRGGRLREAEGLAQQYQGLRQQIQTEVTNTLNVNVGVQTAEIAAQLAPVLTSLIQDVRDQVAQQLNASNQRFEEHNFQQFSNNLFQFWGH